MTRTRVPRFRGALAGTLLLTTLGLLYAEARLFAAAAIPLAYVAVGALSSLSGASEPEIERTLTPSSPPPGGEVEVTLTVRNSGESALTDVRVVDGVPDELAVSSGSPRCAVALRPGEEETVSYSVVAKRGEYEFDGPAVRVRTTGATDRVTTAVEASGGTTLSCARSAADPPFGRASPRNVGTHTTDSGGEGLEFHSTREYRPGDPISRIDWRRFAKSGDLTTVRFREERAARTVVVVDARPVARTTPSAAYPNGAALSVYAGERLYDALTGAGVATSVTALGLAADDVTGELPADDLLWADADGAGSARLVFDAAGRAADRDGPGSVPTDGTDPVADANHVGDRTRGGGPARTSDAGPDRDADAESSRAAPTPDGGEPAGGPPAGSSLDSATRRLLARLPGDAQVVLVSPVLDDWPASLARSLSARGHDLAVLSPDVSGDSDDSPGRTVAATRREMRLRDLRTAGATTIDWSVDDPLGIALERSLRTLL
ncbi:DUF58 domain-containing protein [Halorussus gelatinilyticus]|uniref:DUF58 domain-containing protein n=1 Tax=Halorussus gelatinilyticus TaxID=2937524 RepID=A0A8U0IHD3_9EURY|nr:DUF58 domain-containing protein [Halorussus gelatinilyticus]UPV99713.1 DUF58 domain-containing protein [Halorussus gelatinilyticus]